MDTHTPPTAPTTSPPPPTRGRGPDRRARTWTVLTVLVALAGVASAAIVLLGAERPPDVVAEEVAVPRSDRTTTSPGPTTTEAAPRPAGPGRVVIDRIDVDAEVIDLGLDPEGALEVPTDFAQTGWWTGGARPGEEGPAVIVGHVDSVDGPAVFFRLEELVPGDEVTVVADDGTPTTFVVERSRQVAKDDFPTEEVYGATDEAELRLVTCDGDFDRSTGHYDDNLIVFLRAVGTDA